MYIVVDAHKKGSFFVFISDGRVCMAVCVLWCQMSLSHINWFIDL